MKTHLVEMGMTGVGNSTTESIVKARKEKTESCMAEIQSALEKHGCALAVAVVLRNGQVISQVSVVAKS